MSLFPNREIAEQTQSLGDDKEIVFTLNSLTPGVAFVVETVNDTYGNALKAWKEIGCPEPPDRIQTQELKEIGKNTKKGIFKVNNDGILNVRLVLKPWSIVFLSEINSKI